LFVDIPVVGVVPIGEAGWRLNSGVRSAHSREIPLADDASIPLYRPPRDASSCPFPYYRRTRRLRDWSSPELASASLDYRPTRIHPTQKVERLLSRCEESTYATLPWGGTDAIPARDGSGTMPTMHCVRADSVASDHTDARPLGCDAESVAKWASLAGLLHGARHQAPTQFVR